VKAKALILLNELEIMEFDKLGLTANRPKAETGTIDFYFDLRLVSTGFVTVDGFIRICIAGKDALLVYEEEVWIKIKAYLE
jgi:hypothetical protein